MWSLKKNEGIVKKEMAKQNCEARRKTNVSEHLAQTFHSPTHSTLLEVEQRKEHAFDILIPMHEIVPDDVQSLIDSFASKIIS